MSYGNILPLNEVGAPLIMTTQRHDMFRLSSACMMVFIASSCGGGQYTPEPAANDIAYVPSESDSSGTVDITSTPREDSISATEGSDTETEPQADVDVLDVSPVPDTGSSDTAMIEDVAPAPDEGIAPKPIDCGLYRLWCDGTCVAYTVDPAHCGACDSPCGPTQVCSAGQCTDSECLGSLTPCESTCVNTATNSAHCGACNTACAEGQFCSEGGCVDALSYSNPDGCDEITALALKQDGNTACTGTIAQQAFKWALCSCAEINLSGQVATDSYDSLTAAYAPGGIYGDLATNSNVYMSNMLSVGGNLHIAGQYGLTSNNKVSVAQALRSHGQINLSVPSTVATDGFVNGKITTSTTLDFAGTLTQPAGISNAGLVTAGAYVTEAVTVTPPCPCSGPKSVPVSSLMTTYSDPANNDNEAIALEANVLASPNGAQHLQLPCGVYYLSSISNTAPVTITTTGKTALFISGGINISGTLRMHPSPGSELDIFVTGAISVNGKAVIGSPNYPAATRMYIGGNNQVLFANSLELAGYLYSDEASLNVNNALDIFGGLSVYQLLTRNTLAVHYDTAVEALPDYCAPTP